jgi:hypothetical protein
MLLILNRVLLFLPQRLLGRKNLYKIYLKLPIIYGTYLMDYVK